MVSILQQQIFAGTHIMVSAVDEYLEQRCPGVLFFSTATFTILSSSDSSLG